ncbi:rhodanese-like domain-containing protein [Fundidesulfovibrio butyratiphilus]
MALKPPRIRDLTPSEVETLLAEHQPGEITLLDVRQDWEYAQKHIPQALHIPLPDLLERLGEVPFDNPMVIYCASGRRSLSAAALLVDQGARDVFNMRGGIKAWTGPTASGDRSEGFASAQAKLAARDLFAQGLALEINLGLFYAAMARKVEDPELAALFIRLAGFEDTHKNKLQGLFAALFPGEVLKASPASPDILEGGLTAERMFDEMAVLASMSDVLDMAMGLEAQALDLYTRLGQTATNPQLRQAVHLLAKEEQTHLKALGTLLDRLG